MTYVNLADLESLAREILPPSIYDFIAGGAEDEVTLRSNRAAFEAIQLRARVLVNVTNIDTATSVLGQAMPSPVMLAPVAMHRTVNDEGELATARGAASVGATMVLSTMSTCTLEQVAAAAGGPKWFQLYCYSDRAITERLIRRAETAGYKAICLTVDVPRLGRRERDFRHATPFPPHIIPKNFADDLDLESIRDNTKGSALMAMTAALLDPSLTWDAIGWLKSITSLPIAVKGILTAEDAVLAVDHGASAIAVSNHGGRQLDGVPASIEALPEIAEAVAGRVELLVDGGVRRGTDVLKALALGAHAVLIGRPYIWGLAVDGENGVARVLRMLNAELELAMSLAGVTSIDEITSALVRRP